MSQPKFPANATVTKDADDLSKAVEVTPAIIDSPQPRPIRWNDDLDRDLLLTLVSVCKEQGVGMPYEEIARRMGAPFTERSITQHIGKLHERAHESADPDTSLTDVPIQAAQQIKTMYTPTTMHTHSEAISTTETTPRQFRTPDRAQNRIRRSTYKIYESSSEFDESDLENDRRHRKKSERKDFAPMDIEEVGEAVKIERRDGSKIDHTRSHSIEAEHAKLLRIEGSSAMELEDEPRLHVEGCS